MSDDIVARLRTEVAKAETAGVLPNWELAKCMWEAADEIERLRTTLEKKEWEIKWWSERALEQQSLKWEEMKR